MSDEKSSESQVYLVAGRAAVECLRVLRQIDQRLKRDGLPAFFPDQDKQACAGGAGLPM